MKHLRRIALVLTLLLLISSCAKSVQITDYSIIPEPTYMVQKGRTFSLSLRTNVCFENLGQNSPTAKYISSTFRQMHIRPKFSGSQKQGCITFSLNDTINPALAEEGYLLQVTPSGIFISANTEAGIFYAFQTLIQMLPDDITSTNYRLITIPECTILDSPAFPWRCSHLDCCSHFFTVKQIKNHLDLMAAYKLNKFHWHLADDHGWRIEVESHPLLNDIASWRVDRTTQPWGKAAPAQPGETPTYGGFYTRSQISEIVEYAAQRHIEVIPEIDLPSHASAILAAYPELSCDGGTYSVALGPLFPTPSLCLGNPQTIQFIDNILDEMCQLFPSEYIHLGFFEDSTDAWSTCPRCQALAHQQGLKSTQSLTNWLLTHIEEYLARHGKRIAGWDDILDNDNLSTTALVTASSGTGYIHYSTLHGNPTIDASSSLALDYYQTDSTHMPAAAPRFLTLSQLYNYTPLSHNLSSDLQHHLLGAEATLHTGYITSYDQAQYQLLPRLCAFAECLWTPADHKNWEHFRRKIEHHKLRLTDLGYHICPGNFKPQLIAERQGTEVIATLTLEVADTYLYYTTDGTDPTTDSPLYLEPLRLPVGTEIRTLTLYHGQPQERIYTFHL